MSENYGDLITLFPFSLSFLFLSFFSSLFPLFILLLLLLLLPYLSLSLFFFAPSHASHIFPPTLFSLSLALSLSIFVSVYALVYLIPIYVYFIFYLYVKIVFSFSFHTCFFLAQKGSGRRETAARVSTQSKLNEGWGRVCLSV